jgi:acetyl esterase
MTILETDVVFARPGGMDLLARIYRSDEKFLAKGIISVHGGAWNKNDRTSIFVLNRALAAAGLLVLSLDFRQGPDFKHPSASQDIAAGVRHLRVHAEYYGIDANDIGIIGSSSGGQLALLAALAPDSEQYFGTPVVDLQGQAAARDDVPAGLSYVLSLWPVSDPLRRYRYAKEVGRDDLLAGHHMYFRDEAQMNEASVPRMLENREAQVLPPLWLAQPGADLNVPTAMTLDLLAAYQALDGYVEYVFYPGEPHAITREDTPSAQRCIRDLLGFIARRLDSQ